MHQDQNPPACEFPYQVTLGAGQSRVVFACIADDDDHAAQLARQRYPALDVVTVERSSRPGMPKARFTAYRLYPGTQKPATHHVHGLTREEVNDETRFPLGPQKDESGNLFIWSYGINNGNPVY